MNALTPSRTTPGRQVVLMMLKAPEPHAVKTRLAARVGPDAAVRIYRCLVERQLAAIPALVEVHVHHDPPDAGPLMRAWLSRPAGAGPLRFVPQSGGDLGARLVAAFESAFTAGAQAAVAIGGDCPSLDEAFLADAFSHLEDHDVVLGPAADGGYTLIGLRAPQPRLFASIQWSTPAVLGETRQRIRHAGLRCHELAVHEDVDDEPSYLRAVARGLLPPLV